MLRDYQIQIIKDVYKSWMRGRKRPCIVAPCGSGKTIIAAELAKLTADLGDRVLFVVHRKEICDQTIKKFREHGVNMELCAVGMVNTLAQRKLLNPKLIIMDENHHVYAASYIKIIELYPKARVVGLTATPTRFDGSGLGRINDDLIFGPSVSELISMGHLAPFKYYSHISADTSKLQIRKGEFVVSKGDAFMEQDFIYGDAVENYKKYGLRKAIVYCSSIKNSLATADAFKAASIAAVHADGKTSKRERDNIMEDFRTGRIKVLCNVDLVSEGFDVPDCDSVILMRPTMSLTLHIQQSMRCMRYMPGKTAIIVDMVGNYKLHGLPDRTHPWGLGYYTSYKSGECAAKVSQGGESDDLRKGWLNNKDDVGTATFTCDKCSSVYNGMTIYCEPCGGWDMRRMTCTNCKEVQQYGFGDCAFCGGSFSPYIENGSGGNGGGTGGGSRKEREQIQAELQEIKSYRFKSDEMYKVIDDLRRIQKANGTSLS